MFPMVWIRNKYTFIRKRLDVEYNQILFKVNSFKMIDILFPEIITSPIKLDNLRNIRLNMH
jgi:hypothetical protein